MNITSSSKRIAVDREQYSTNILLKRRRGSALPDEDVRHQDNDKLLQHQPRRKRIRITKLLVRENIIEYFKILRR